jgi:hypothetical protein
MTGECRGECCGCKNLQPPICSRTSGEQLNRIQSTSSALIAIDDWVRRLTRASPFQNNSQMRHLQFHCGDPPPAADPSTIDLT